MRTLKSIRFSLFGSPMAFSCLRPPAASPLAPKSSGYLKTLELPPGHAASGRLDVQKKGVMSA